MEERFVQTICDHCGCRFVAKFTGGEIRYCPCCGKRFGVLDADILYEFVSKERETLPDGEYGTYVEVSPAASEEKVQETVSSMIKLFAANLLCKHARFIDKLSDDPLCQMRTIGIKCRVQDGELIFNLREGYNNESET